MGRANSLRQKAWEKCQGTCHLCGLLMAPDSVPCSPLSFTVEHIIPKSRGGTNDIDNINGSHQWCNNAKGDALMEELPPSFRGVLRWKVKNLLANMKITKEEFLPGK